MEAGFKLARAFAVQPPRSRLQPCCNAGICSPRYVLLGVRAPEIIVLLSASFSATPTSWSLKSMCLKHSRQYAGTLSRGVNGVASDHPAWDFSSVRLSLRQGCVVSSLESDWGVDSMQ